MTTTSVDPTNQAQAQAWDGREGDVWATHCAQFEAMLEGYQPAFAAASHLRVDDDVLDIGCGTGSTTMAAARTARHGMALGVDLSSRMLAVARQRAVGQGVDNVRFERADAQVHPFAASGFDAAMSRTGAMFFGDPERAFRNVGRALRPGGRLTLLTWQPSARNPWSGTFARTLLGAVPAPRPGPGPFSLSDPDQIAQLLASTGFRDVDITGLSEPMTYGPTVDDAHSLLLGLLGWMLEQRRPEDRPAASQALRDALADHVRDAGVQFDSAAWLVTARRG